MGVIVREIVPKILLRNSALGNTGVVICPESTVFDALAMIPRYPMLERLVKAAKASSAVGETQVSTAKILNWADKSSTGLGDFKEQKPDFLWGLEMFQFDQCFQKPVLKPPARYGCMCCKYVMYTWIYLYVYILCIDE